LLASRVIFHRVGQRAWIQRARCERATELKTAQLLDGAPDRRRTCSTAHLLDGAPDQRRT